MTALTFFQIFSVCLLGAMSPGPSMLVVINNAIFKGRYHGLLTSLGHGIGISIYALFAVLGIGLLINTNIYFFQFIKILSVVFLFYLGVVSVMKKRQLNLISRQNKEASSFFQGLSISVLNPKIFIWFVAIYSQFFSYENSIFFNCYLVLTAGIVDTSWYIFLTLLVTSKKSLELLTNKELLISKAIGITFIIISILISLNIMRDFIF